MKVIFFTVLFCAVTHGLKLSVIPPTKNVTTEVAIIFTPGSGIPGEAYRSLAVAVQMTSPVRLWCVLLEDFPGNVPTLETVEQGVDLGIRALQGQGMKSSNVFIAGHGTGGEVSSIYATQHHDQLKGVLLLGASLPHNYTLIGYPLPLLTLSGDLDGINRITHVYNRFEELKRDTKTNSSTLYRAPVIIIEGANHAQFASGSMPPSVSQNDIEPDLSEDSAHTIIAGHVSNFLVTSLQEPVGSLNQSKAELHSAYTKTDAIMNPIETVKSWDENEQHSSVVSVLMQGMILGTTLSKHITANNTVIPIDDIKQRQPLVTDHNATNAHIQTYTSVLGPALTGVIGEPYTPRELQAKAKSKAAIRALLPNVSVDILSMSCREANMMSYTFATEEASYTAQNRATARQAPFMHFHHDVIVKTLADWFTTPLKLEYGENGSLEVTAVAYISPVKYPQQELAGMHHCKLLSPLRALEWYYLDSLKKRKTGNGESPFVG